MGRIVERRIPEGHDGVAHVFVDSALLLEDDIGQRRQVLVEEGGELDGREALGQRGERTDVAEHQRQLALLSAELKLLRVLGQPGHDGGRHVTAEGRADLAHLLALLAVELSDAREEDEARRQARRQRVDKDAVFREREPADIRHGRHRDHAEQRGPVDRDERQQRGERQRKHGARDEFRPRRPVGPFQSHARKDLLDELSMRFHPGRRRIERRRDDVAEHRGARADEHELACKIGEIGVRLEDFPCRDRTARVGFGEPHPQLAVGLHRNGHVAVLDRVDDLALAGRVSVGGRRFHEIAWSRPGRPAASPTPGSAGSGR